MVEEDAAADRGRPDHDVVLTLLGGFQQVAGAADNFAPSGTHRTEFGGAGGHTVQFATPGLLSETT